MVIIDSRRRSASFLKIIKLKPAAFFATHVKHLYLSSFIFKIDALRILSVCTNLESLSCTVYDDLRAQRIFDAMSISRPKYLCIDIGNIFGLHPDIDFANPFFSNVTHLELRNTSFILKRLTDLCLLPSLTHLSLDLVESATVASLREFLAECYWLSVLVLSPYKTTTTTGSTIDDPRLIHLSAMDRPSTIGNWEASSRGYANRWTYAEEVVRERLMLCGQV